MSRSVYNVKDNTVVQMIVAILVQMTPKRNEGGQDSSECKIMTTSNAVIAEEH